MDTAAPNSTEVTRGNSIMKPNEILRRGLLAKQAARRLGGRLQENSAANGRTKADSGFRLLGIKQYLRLRVVPAEAAGPGDPAT